MTPLRRKFYFLLLLFVQWGIFVLVRDYTSSNVGLITLYVLVVTISLTFVGLIFTRKKDMYEPATKEDIERFAELYGRNLSNAEKEGRRITWRVIKEALNNAETERLKEQIEEAAKQEENGTKQKPL